MADTGETTGVDKTPVSKEACTWAMYCHLAGLGWLLWWVVPFVGGVIGVLIIWQIKKDQYSFVNENGKEAMNFQISMLIYWLASAVLCFCGIGLVLMPIVAVLDIVFTITAAIKASNGEHYHYPLSIRFVK